MYTITEDTIMKYLAYLREAGRARQQREIRSGAALASGVADTAGARYTGRIEQGSLLRWKRELAEEATPPAR